MATPCRRRVTTATARPGPRDRDRVTTGTARPGPRDDRDRDRATTGTARRPGPRPRDDRDRCRVGESWVIPVDRQPSGGWHDHPPRPEARLGGRSCSSARRRRPGAGEEQVPRRNGPGIELLADPIRRRLVAALALRPRRPSSLALEVGLSRPATSRQLRLLRDACLVRSSRSMTDRRALLFSIEPRNHGQITAWLAGTEIGRPTTRMIDAGWADEP